jgi:diguanylate cyclase (GGDEF)-like protein
MRESWRWYLAVAMAACAAYFVLPATLGTLAFLVIAASSVVAMCVGVRRHRPPGATTTWWWLIAARALWVVGDGLYLYYLMALHQEPYPSPGDIAYLAGYAGLVVGLMLLIRQRSPGKDRASLLDATIVASGIGLLAWVFLVEPVATDTQSSLLIRLTTTAYPVLDLLLLVLLVRLLVGSGERNAAFRLLTASIVVALVADVGNALLAQVIESSSRGSVLALVVDQGYLVSHVLFGAAALHPSIRALSEQAGRTKFQFTRRRLYALTAAALLAPALLGAEVIRGTVNHGAAIAIASAGLFILVVVRMNGLIGQIKQQAAELETLSQHDPLTGAANRRAWDSALPLALDRARRDGTQLVIVLLDLDHFKRFNDTYGHQMGDRLLEDAVTAWRPRLRQGDVLARYGGEEFVVLLPQASLDHAYNVVERLRQAMPLGQSFSAGLAVWDGDEPSDALLARADAALYAAKDAGRDRVVLAPTG